MITTVLLEPWPQGAARELGECGRLGLGWLELGGRPGVREWGQGWAGSNTETLGEDGVVGTSMMMGESGTKGW